MHYVTMTLRPVRFSTPGNLTYT